MNQLLEDIKTGKDVTGRLVIFVDNGTLGLEEFLAFPDTVGTLHTIIRHNNSMLWVKPRTTEGHNGLYIERFRYAEPKMILMHKVINNE
jgi:hypothetical protein